MREGASIGPYRVVRKIGEGGMGAVYLGEHTLIGRHAAIKVLLPELSSRRESVDRFFNEARATTAITDPGIVQVFDFGITDDNVAFIVMELLEGEQLSVRLDRLGALSPGDALRITRQAAGSLGAAHAAGIVHRDLKPENLFMVRDAEALGGERPKIMDFGIAKLGDAAPDRVRTRTGAVLGTPVYMSPEQCDGAGRIDHRADIYSLGCVMFHLLTGRPPFDLPGLGAVISAHLREPAPPPTQVSPHLPPQIDALVLRCLAKAPDDRFATMFELQQACDAVLARITGGASASRSMPIAAPGVASLSAAVPAPSSGAPSSLGASPDAARTTTLGTLAGERTAVSPRSRRRLALWMTLAVVVGGGGAAIAVLSTRPHARGASPPAGQAIEPGPVHATGELPDKSDVRSASQTAVPVGTGAAAMGTGTAAVETGAVAVGTGTAAVETGAAAVGTGTAAVETGAAAVGTGAAAVAPGGARVPATSHGAALVSGDAGMATSAPVMRSGSPDAAQPPSLPGRPAVARPAAKRPSQSAATPGERSHARPIDRPTDRPRERPHEPRNDLPNDLYDDRN